MKIGKTLDVKGRNDWRRWLREHHRTEGEIWLIYNTKKSGKKRIPYNDAVDEAICFGWIDSTVKKLDAVRSVQRFSPRRKNSKLSELNKERVRRLMKARKMSRAGLESIRHEFEESSWGSAGGPKLKEFKLPADIVRILKSDPAIWKNFSKFPKTYKSIRVAWIDAARHRPEAFRQRLNYFLKMTSRNKIYGMLEDRTKPSHS